jgi:DNA-binding transcriptional LysR family regulator
MDLLQLEHVLAVVEERTFTRAAERMCRTQPAISQSIKKLEEELGTQLFARDLHDVSLTEAGKELVVYARRMVATRDEAMRHLGALKALTSGTLNVAAHESAAVYLLPAPLRCRN